MVVLAEIKLSPEKRKEKRRKRGQKRREKSEGRDC
jgi:hypothetical protein